MNIIKPTWPQPSNIHAFTTLKNCNIEDLNLPNNKFLITQEHGINILSAQIDLPQPPIADGSYTINKNLVCLVKTADCLPILITNIHGTFVAAIHAGWRGLANSIINNFFMKIKPLNLITKDLLFWLGPAIGPLAFEVGKDVLDQFEDVNINHPHKKLNLYNSAFITKNNLDKYLADIYQIAKINLYQCGIHHNQIFSENVCTYSREDLFYSYRRNPGCNNRMHSLIWIS